MHTAYITISTHSYDSDTRRTKPETDFLGLFGAERRWERLVEGPELLETCDVLLNLELVGRLVVNSLRHIISTLVAEIEGSRPYGAHVGSDKPSAVRENVLEGSHPERNKNVRLD